MQNLLKKLSKSNQTVLIVVFVLAFSGLSSLAAPYLDVLVSKVLARILPDVGKIYDTERAHFPKYQVGVTKNVLGAAAGRQYAVTLNSSSMPTREEAADAGKIACGTGMREGTNVIVLARRQYFHLPIYSSRGIVGECKGGSWVVFESHAPSPSAPSQEAITQPCQSADLSFAIEPNAQTTTYRTYGLWLTFTNKSAHECTLSGYPKVSLVDHDGATLGQADDLQSYVLVTLTLPPGQTVYAAAEIPNPGQQDPGACTAKSTSMHIYPPEETTLALSAPASYAYCSGFSVGPFRNSK